MKTKILVLLSCFSIILNGCASVSNLSTLSYIKEVPNSISSFDITKLKYDEKLRGYSYDNKIILDATTGKKIKDKEKAINTFQLVYKNEPKTTKDKIVIGCSLVYIVPVAIVKFGTDIVLSILNLPLIPSMKYFSKRFLNTVFENFEKGVVLLGENNFKEARLYFNKALNYENSLIYSSKIYYLIAQTYELEGNAKEASKYYGLFLDYAVRLYPEFFTKYNPLYVDDVEKLNILFDQAESKIRQDETLN